MADGAGGLTDSRVEEVLRTHAKLYADRANFNNTWQTVSERVLPNYSDFITMWTPGQRRTNRVFDSTAVLALEHFCAALESMLCPASTRWHKLRPTDPRLAQDIEIQQYLDIVTDCLFRARYAPGANFQSQIHESFAQIGAFGNGPILVDDEVGYGLRYRVQHLAEVYGIENDAGVIDYVSREFKMTAKACLDAFNHGKLDFLPDKIREAAEKNPIQQFEFVRAIYPNRDYNAKARDLRGMAFTSCTVSKDLKVLVRESGYHTQPLLYPRYRVAPKETYGRGPGVDVLPEILSLNQMAKSQMRQAERAIEPPIMLMDDGALGAFDLRANALNYAMLTANGEPMAKPFMTGSNFEISKEMLDSKRLVVERAFLTDIFSILTQQPEMTATEVLQRAQEKGQLLAPIIGRIQSELFGPMITRELDILQRAGQLPPPPDKLKKYGGRLDYEVVYESEIQVIQRKTKALAIAATFQQIEPWANADPSVFKAFNATRAAQIIADANGAPAAIMNTPDEIEAEKQAAMQQQQITNLAQLAGPASQAIKNLTDAQRAGGSAVPANIPGL